MSEIVQIKNTVNNWMGEVGKHSLQALNEITTQNVIRELSPSGMVSMIDVAMSTGACFFPLLSNAKQIAGGLSMQAIKSNIQPPSGGKTAASGFQIYGRRLLNSMRDKMAAQLHNTAMFRWRNWRMKIANTDRYGRADTAPFLQELMQNTFKPRFIKSAENMTLHGNAMTAEVKKALQEIYRNLKQAQAAKTAAQRERAWKVLTRKMY